MKKVKNDSKAKTWDIPLRGRSWRERREDGKNTARNLFKLVLFRHRITNIF